MKINNKEVEITESANWKHYKYFASTFKDEDDKFWEAALKEYNGEGYTHVVSALILDLEHSFNASISYIHADMWFAIKMETNDASLYITCDIVEYGLLCAVLILEQAYGRNDAE